MGFFSRKKKPDGAVDVTELTRLLHQRDAEKLFYLNAARSLLVFIKQFPLNLKEIDTPGFIKRMDDLTAELTGEKKISQQESVFEKAKKQILSFVGRHKQCIEDREKEFKDIIRLLTKAMADLGVDNREYNDKIFEKTEKIEKLTELDDIKIIKSSIKQEVAEIQTAVSEKQKKDTQQISMLSDKVTVLEEELRKAESKSQRDGLTGIYNRQAFDRKIKNLVDNQVIGNGHFALLMIDIDDFKPINDKFGHQVGDRVILAVVKKITGHVRADDFSARYGGEEFAVILPGTNLKNAVKKAKEIGKSLAATRYAISPNNGDQICVTVSIGVSTCQRGDTAEFVLNRADKALYKAKNAGKNRVVSEKEL